jgi:catechol 2,3-dioxygenase-like lactoylglutathione lyase family enzyme
MITKLSHVNIYVLDQDAALEFYTQKLGFEVRTDFKMDNGFRWLTVGPKSQPELEIILFAVKPDMGMDAETAGHLRAILEKGGFGGGVLEVDDCRATYEDLKSKGVEFVSPPNETFYGIEAIMKDNSGNWFSMTQRK